MKNIFIIHKNINFCENYVYNIYNESESLDLIFDEFY